MATVRELIRTWLTGRPGPIFGPPLMAEVTVLLDGSGRGHVYAPRVTSEADHATIAAGIIRAGAWYAECHGLHVTQIGPKEAT